MTKRKKEIRLWNVWKVTKDTCRNQWRLASNWKLVRVKICKTIFLFVVKYTCIALGFWDSSIAIWFDRWHLYQLYILVSISDKTEEGSQALKTNSNRRIAAQNACHAYSMALLSRYINKTFQLDPLMYIVFLYQANAEQKDIFTHWVIMVWVPCCCCEDKCE